MIRVHANDKMIFDTCRHFIDFDEHYRQGDVSRLLELL